MLFPFLIDTSHGTMKQPSPPLDMSGAPSVPCVNYGKHVAISQLRIHEDGCSGGPSTASPTLEKVHVYTVCFHTFKILVEIRDKS